MRQAFENIGLFLLAPSLAITAELFMLFVLHDVSGDSFSPLPLFIVVSLATSAWLAKSIIQDSQRSRTIRCAGWLFLFLWLCALQWLITGLLLFIGFLSLSFVWGGEF